jgi:carboxyl-terminal processing protease
VKKLRGPKGSPVKITVLHQDGRVEDITVVRDIIRPTSIKDPHFVDEKQKIAYLRMTQFQKRTAEDLDKTVKQLQAEGMRALIIDLRANPGGLLNAAVDICDRFTDDGVIVSTRGRKSRPRTFRATKGVTYPDIPVALLVSSHSASAAEIFAGAIQDHKRGVIVGVRSYGKGSVQSLFRLENGKSGIRLTTAHYYTPSGRLIHRNQNNADQKEWGIDPDIEVKVTLKDEIALWKSWRDRHQANIDKKNGTNGKDDTKEEPAKPDDKEKEDNWIPDSKQNPDTPPEGAKKDEPFVDRTLEAAVNAMKGMILAGERMAPAAEKAAK